MTIYHISNNQATVPNGRNKLLLGDGTTIDSSNINNFVDAYKQQVAAQIPAPYMQPTPDQVAARQPVDPLASNGSISAPQNTQPSYTQTDRFGHTWNYVDDNSGTIGGGGYVSTTLPNGKVIKNRYTGYSIGSDGTRNYNTLSYPTGL